MGLFFSPAILFFAFSGALQTFNLHKTDARTGYTPPMWIQEIAQIHKSQNMNVRTKGKPKKAESDTVDPELDDAPALKKGATPNHSALPMKWFVVLMSSGLIVTTALGIYMSFSYGGYPRLAWVALIAGVVVPIALLMF
ncbi:PepSY domain-containing protein [Acidicapsa acidisoli]|uniref:PepSY domain-containing protein n=1 Tax=Acidicapsa acidisoli TaxID=1615681 RepID=UPI0021DF9897|nr:PepSY domain-containing protein [Acidicapsa acidisoli]